MCLPKKIENIVVPPIKCQGIKTKLVEFIGESIKWDGNGRWIEPFLGSGVVLFNILPEKAIVNDKNRHIIEFYKQIQDGKITPKFVREYLEYHGSKLFEQGESYYYEMREKFNTDDEPIDLLFINRAAFNGMMRFNKNGMYNVPFCKKENRFRKAYITKIVNQVEKVQNIIHDKDWEFISTDWRNVIDLANEGDFIYADPPYVGRHTGYVGDWDNQEAVELANALKESKAGFALSMWKENKYRKNPHITECWNGFPIITKEHFYHVGSKESLRNSMEEALIIKEGYCISMNG